MKATKSIPDSINKPQLDEDFAKDEMSAESIELSKTFINKVEIEAGLYRYIDISDCELSNSILNTVICFRSSIVRTVIDKGQLTGLQLPEGHFLDFTLKNSKANLSNFRNSKFKLCHIIETDLSEADFSGSKLTRVRFESCMLDKVDFSNCTSDMVEFIDCSLASINGLASFKGVSISEKNLIEISPILASELGIKIQD